MGTVAALSERASLWILLAVLFVLVAGPGWLAKRRLRERRLEELAKEVHKLQEQQEQERIAKKEQELQTRRQERQTRKLEQKLELERLPKTEREARRLELQRLRQESAQASRSVAQPPE